jgi:hypothetical protein
VRVLHFRVRKFSLARRDPAKRLHTILRPQIKKFSPKVLSRDALNNQSKSSLTLLNNCSNEFKVFLSTLLGDTGFDAK